MTRLWLDRQSHSGAGFEYCGLILEYKTQITPNDYFSFSKEVEAHDYRLGIKIEEKLETVYKIGFSDSMERFKPSIEESEEYKVAHELINQLKKQKTEISKCNVNLICENLTECLNMILK